MPEIDLSPDQMNPTFATQNPPVDTDLVTFKTSAGIWVTCTMAQMKAFLKTYNDTLYLISGGALGTPTSGNLASCTGYSHTNLTTKGFYTHNQVETLMNRVRALTSWNSFDAVGDWSYSVLSTSQNTTIFRQGTGSVNLYGTFSAGSINRGSLASTNLTNKIMFIFVYIDSSAVLAKLSFINMVLSSDGVGALANYWSRSWSASELHIGWNMCYVIPADGYDSSKTGSPNVTAMNRLYFAVYNNGSQTLSAGNLMVDDLCYTTNPEGYII